jgi:hypothetical protein
MEIFDDKENITKNQNFNFFTKYKFDSNCLKKISLGTNHYLILIEGKN